MATTNNNSTSTSTSNPAKPEQPEGPKPLAEAERLKLSNELAERLLPLTPLDRRHVLQAVATSLGVATSAARQPQQQQRQPARNGGR